MKTDYTLTVRLRPALHNKIAAYAERTGLTLAGSVRCWIASIEGPDGEKELDAAIVKMTAKRDALRKTAAADRPQEPPQ